PKSRNPVYYPDIDSFGIASLPPAHFFQRHIENSRSCGGMDILIVLKGFYHVLPFAKGSTAPQLNLGIIGSQDDIIFIPGYKGFSYLPSSFCSYWDILKIWIIRTQSPCGGHSLHIICMYSSGDFFHLRR